MYSFDHTTHFPNIISDLNSLNQVWCTVNLLKQRKQSLYVYQMIDKWMRRWLKSEVCNEIDSTKSYQDHEIRELSKDDKFKIKLIKKGRTSAQGRALSANAQLPLKQQKRKEKLIRKALESLPNTTVSRDNVTPSDGISSISTICESLHQLETSIYTENNQKSGGVNYWNYEKYKEVFENTKKHSPSSSDHQEANVGSFDSNEVSNFSTKTFLSDSLMHKISNTPEKSEINILNNRRDGDNWINREIRIHNFNTNLSESSQTTASEKRTVITIKKTRFFLPSNSDKSLTSPMKHQLLKPNTNVTARSTNDSLLMIDSQKYVSNSLSTTVSPLSNNQINCVFDSSNCTNKRNDLEIVKGNKLGREVDEVRHDELQHDIQRSVQNCLPNTKTVSHAEDPDTITDNITNVGKMSKNKALKNTNSYEEYSHLLWSDNSLLNEIYDAQDVHIITDTPSRIRGAASSSPLQSTQVAFTRASSISPTNFLYATENCADKHMFKQNNAASLKRLCGKLRRVRKHYWFRSSGSSVNSRNNSYRNMPGNWCNLSSYSQDRNSMKSTVLFHNSDQVSDLHKWVSSSKKVKRGNSDFQQNNNSYQSTNSEKSSEICAAENVILSQQTNSMSLSSVDRQSPPNVGNNLEQNSEKLSSHSNDGYNVTARGAESPLMKAEDLRSSTLSEDAIKNLYCRMSQPADDTSDTFRFSVLSEFLHSTSDELTAYKHKPRPGLATGRKRTYILNDNKKEKPSDENIVTLMTESESEKTSKEDEVDSLEAVDSLPTSFQSIKAYDSPQIESESIVEPIIIKAETQKSFHRSKYKYQRPFRYRFQSLLSKGATLKTGRQTGIVSSAKFSRTPSHLPNKKYSKEIGISKPQSLTRDKRRKARRMQKSTRRQPAITSSSRKQSNVKSTTERSRRVREKRGKHLQKNKSPRKIKYNQVKHLEKITQKLRKLQHKPNTNLVSKIHNSLNSPYEIENSYQKLSESALDMNRLHKIRQNMENSRMIPSNFAQTRKVKLKHKKNSDKRKVHQAKAVHNDDGKTHDYQSDELRAKTLCFKRNKRAVRKKSKSDEISHSSSQAQNQPHNRKKSISQQKSLNKQVKNKKQSNSKLLKQKNINQMDGDKVNEKFVQMKNQFDFTAYLTIIPYEIDEIVLPFRANNKIHSKLRQIYSFISGLDKKLLEDMPPHNESNIKDVSDENLNTTSSNFISLTNHNRSSYLDEINKRGTRRKSILINCFPEGDVKMQNIKLVPVNNNAPSQYDDLAYPTYLPKINENIAEFWHKLLYKCNDTRLSKMIDELRQITDRRIFAIECKCKCRIILNENIIYSITALPCMQLRIVSYELKNVQQALSELENHLPNVYKQLVFTERFHESESFGSSSNLPTTKSFLIKSILQGIKKPPLSTMQRLIPIIERTKQKHLK